MDKLKNQSEMQQCLKGLRESASEAMLCSAETGRGVREIWQAILKIKTRQSPLP
jgi:hypothetical protein